MLPSPDILNDFDGGKFVLSNLAAKRANQIKEGAPPLVQIDSIHPLTIALAEIAAGKIKPIYHEVEELVEDQTNIKLLDETLPAELGMLLPALDETEVELVASPSLLGDDLEPDIDLDETEEPIINLADLVEEEEEPATVVASEDDTLSLTDVAEQENIEDEEEGV